MGFFEQAERVLTVLTFSQEDLKASAKSSAWGASFGAQYSRQLNQPGEATTDIGSTAADITQDAGRAAAYKTATEVRATHRNWRGKLRPNGIGARIAAARAI